MGWLWSLGLRSYALSGPVMMLLYPLYASIMAIESPYKEDDQQWLTYWVLYSLVSLLEMAAGPVIAWIPFYATAKLLIASWLVLPQFRGGIILYQKFVRPYLNSATGATTDQKLTDGQRKLFASISPEAQASVAEYIKESSPGAFDALMRSVADKSHEGKVEEKVKYGSSSSSDSD